MGNCSNCYKPILVDEFKKTVQDGSKYWTYCTLCQKEHDAHVAELADPDRLIGTEKVIVKDFPVRYNNRRYFKGEDLNIDPADYDEDIFEKEN